MVNSKFSFIHVTPPSREARIGVSNLIHLIVEIPIITHLKFVMWNDILFYVITRSVATW